MADDDAPQPPRQRPDAPVIRGGRSQTRKTLIQTVLPFATSLAFHAALILAAVLVAASVEPIRRVLTQEQVIIPDATLVEGAEVGGTPNPGLSGDPNRASGQTFDESVAVSDDWAERPSESLSSTLIGSDSAEPAGGGGLALGPKAASSAGLGSGSGAPGGGSLAPFGLPGGGGGMGPKAPFMGQSGNARKVIFLSDASGSMMLGGRKGDLFLELRKAIDKLSATQFFNVIFFQKGEAVALDDSQLLAGNTSNKQKLVDFLDRQVQFAPNSNPIPGLEKAFRQSPELVYLLTDGDFSIGSGITNQEVLDTIARLNPGRKVKINTIAFAEPDQRNEPFVKVLQQIADDNGGRFAFVTRDDLR